ncbi:glycine betaine ABC transporter substrate-binding protein [Glaciimonas sp. CA11.2]|uniref:glycine betaine ABC transporter substrate-binding protein n=1 Tax=unclassified Glaciimonas TaxID=2644401 RepID=UPI002AB53A03|nr:MULTISPECIES: glycine betaine ABC transporter substrate-binding protein [unclassified Glaciimonas]MDY7549147.1 glycine betaine ABC transporter substrate-binding protein [Glaciimonas sp. CA11.2]MEB0013977.1 glycine betaine ABC transporter substrate-binding protein [Glaciimonas sp. Cout2]MEB0083182.1 glycine betaine ABC transporter substrate-binding protein [Glaciimonas sp. Gout2]MEB0161718.1 glycine betaine ABC transporter substrate-binding protein [Glaciimonas sp. CA11.2]
MILKLIGSLKGLTLASVLLMSFGVQAAEGTALRLSWFAEPDSEVVTKMAKEVLEQQLGYKVDMSAVALGLQYQGVATGKLDAMLMAWLPNTQAAYWDKFKNRVDDLGVIYEGRLGWVVPDYVPLNEVRTIADLAKPEVRRKLNEKIQGIDAGTGLMRKSEETIKNYNLADYKLVPSSAAAMTIALDHAMRKNDWIVVTGWTPHWMFGKWKLRYLEDPKASLGGAEGVHALSRKGFRKDFPRAADFLEHYKLPLSDLQTIMAEANASSDYDGAISRYLKAHPEKIAEWTTGARKLPLYGN